MNKGQLYEYLYFGMALDHVPLNNIYPMDDQLFK